MVAVTDVWGACLQRSRHQVMMEIKVLGGYPDHAGDDTVVRISSSHGGAFF